LLSPDDHARDPKAAGDLGEVVLVAGGDDHDGVDQIGRRQRADGPLEDGRVPQRDERLGDVESEPFAAAGGDDDGVTRSAPTCGTLCTTARSAYRPLLDVIRLAGQVP
jgi:hypothetical protein